MQSMVALQLAWLLAQSKNQKLLPKLSYFTYILMAGYYELLVVSQLNTFYLFIESNTTILNIKRFKYLNEDKKRKG